MDRLGVSATIECSADGTQALHAMLFIIRICYAMVYGLWYTLGLHDLIEWQKF